MLTLLIEIGNTALKAALSEGYILGKTFRYQGEKKVDFIISLVEREMPSKVCVASVYELSARDAKRLRAACPSLILLDHTHRTVLTRFALPEYLTYDRAAALVAVRHLFRGQACTLIDFGTTLTVDFLSADGTYEGGNVSLGCRTRFKALNRYSRSLPLLDIPEGDISEGTSLTSSITSGIISGIMFEIQGYASSHPGNIVIFTGGDANYFAKRMKNSIFVICNLVMMGLELITDCYECENSQ